MTGRKPSAFHRIRENTSRRLLRFNLALVLLAASPYLGAGATESARQPENVRFVALGDMPYGKNKGASEYAKIRRLLMSPAAPERNLAFSFILHLGDFQDGAARCRDAATHKILPYFESKADEIYSLSDQPVFYTPGDNDWTDCDRHAAGVFELDALDSLRASFYPPRRTAPEGEDWDYHAQEPIEIFGTTFKHPENTRWRVGKVLFATVHLVATRNGRAEIKKSRTQADIHKAVLSAGAREEAAYVWIAETLKLASGTAEVEAVIIAMHVDPDRTDHYADFVGDCPGAARAAAAECDAYVPQPVVFEKLLKTLNSNVETHAMDAHGSPIPVLLLHGDTGGTYLCKAHDRDCINTDVEPCKTYTPKPNRTLTADNLWRLNAMGDYQWDALIIDVDPSAPKPFRATRILEPSGGVAACR